MKFPVFKEARESILGLPEVIKYLTSELSQSLRELRTGLDRLAFLENFETFSVTETIPTSGELAIRNQFPDKTIPTQWLMVDANGDRNIVRGDTVWDEDFLYLKNVGSNSATVTILFFK